MEPRARRPSVLHMKQTRILEYISRYRCFPRAVRFTPEEYAEAVSEFAAHRPALPFIPNKVVGLDFLIIDDVKIPIVVESD